MLLMKISPRVIFLGHCLDAFPQPVILRQHLSKLCSDLKSFQGDHRGRGSFLRWQRSYLPFHSLVHTRGQGSFAKDTSLKTLAADQVERQIGALISGLLSQIGQTTHTLLAQAVLSNASICGFVFSIWLLQFGFGCLELQPGSRCSTAELNAHPYSGKLSDFYKLCCLLPCSEYIVVSR